MTTGIEDAVAAAGNQNRLAILLGCEREAVRQWVVQGYVPRARAIEIEAQLGIPRVRLIDPRLASYLSGEG